MSHVPTPPEIPLLIRADTRPGIGAGHALRQLALAERWTRFGPVTAALDDPPSLVTDRCAAAGVTVVPADDLAGLVRPGGLVVFDGYEFGPEVQAEAKAAGARVVVVDDHGHDGRYEADIVVDPNLGPELDAHRNRPAGTALLHGPRFVLLREEFRGSGHTAHPVDDRVVVLLGGDSDQLAEDLADAVATAVSGRDVEVTTPARAGATGDLATLLRSATLVVSAAGTTTWELAYLGCPAVLVSIAANQESVGRHLSEAGVARYLGPLVQVGPDRVAAAVLELLDDEGEREQQGTAGRALVDGRGPARIAAELLSTTVDLREVNADDAELLWGWANDEAVRAASFDSAPIPWDDHQQWLRRRLAESNGCGYLAVHDGRPWGQVRFDRWDDGHHEIGLSIAAEARGGGRAAALIRAGVQRLFATTDSAVVRARIKEGNERSTAAFLDADFLPEATPSAGAPRSLFYDRGRDGRS